MAAVRRVRRTRHSRPRLLVMVVVVVVLRRRRCSLPVGLLAAHSRVRVMRSLRRVPLRVLLLRGMLRGRRLLGVGHVAVAAAVGGAVREMVLRRSPLLLRLRRRSRLLRSWLLWRAPPVIRGNVRRRVCVRRLVVTLPARRRRAER